jgi:2-keto-4-pentenoate hydratase/2-oxohepta-3-ene-1,7-dioic acid hydratase in catechol pathway
MLFDAGTVYSKQFANGRRLLQVAAKAARSSLQRGDRVMAVEVAFGIGTIVHAGKPATAVVVNDQVATLAEIAARRAAPGPVPLARDFMADWERWHGWLRGLALEPSEGWRPLASVKFTAPVPEPWNIFQTYHNFERPSRITGKADPPKHERVLPDVFLGSRSALAGYGDTVYREHGGQQFDFEIEVTAIIGRPAHRVKAERAEDYVAGYAIANDYTTHFSWWSGWRAKSRINDNIRMKNFPGYTPMSRVIVPRDLAGDPHDLSVKCTVDGVLRQDTRTARMLWTIAELVEYLSHIMPLHPGDLILTGSPEELPLPLGEKKGLRVGQIVVCEVQNLGTLVNTIGEQSERQPNEPAGSPAAPSH